MERKNYSGPSRAPCLEGRLLIRAALTQRPLAPVFDASVDVLPVVLVLESQLQRPEA